MSEPDRVTCGLCHYEFIYGAKVCQGCQGTIVYGATVGEVAESAKNWSVLFGIGAVFLLCMVPFILNSNWAFKIPMGWGLGAWSLLVAGAAFIWGYWIGTNRAHQAHFREVRTIRRT